MGIGYVCHPGIDHAAEALARREELRGQGKGSAFGI